MTESAEPVNPFLVPGWEDAPLRPLCPWNKYSHEEYYIPVDYTQRAFEEFTQTMNHIASDSRLRDDGRVVLVTGESGCGKTALVHRCANWAKKKLEEDSLRGVIIDLTVEFTAGSGQPIGERMSRVCVRLLDELHHEGLLSADVLERMPDERDYGRVYPFLRKVLFDQGVVLLVLLPPSDLDQEVIDYAGLESGNVIFFAESAYLDERGVQRVRDSHRQRTPPIVLEVGALHDEDLHRFVRDRLDRHSNNGTYPRMSEETIDQLAAAGPAKSIAALQKILAEVYEVRRERELRYSANDWVTYKDFADYLLTQFFGNNPRT